VDRILSNRVTGHDRVLKYIVCVGIVFLLILFVGGIAWKQSAIQPIPQYKLVPLYRTVYGFLEPEKRINYTKWRGGETMIDRNNPDITWFRPVNSNEWLMISTDKLTDRLVRKQQLKSPVLSLQSQNAK
jgi:hypothetical protein